MDAKEYGFVSFNFISDSGRVWCQILVSKNAENIPKCKMKPSGNQGLQQTFHSYRIASTGF